MTIVVDIQRIERQTAETVFELRLMGPGGNLDDGFRRKLAGYLVRVRVRVRDTTRAGELRHRVDGHVG